MRQVIIEALIQAAKKAGIENPTIKLEHPEDISHGDFSSNVAMVHAKALKMNPKVLAEKIVVELGVSESKTIQDIKIEGPGFINLYIKKDSITENTKEILKLKEDFGRQTIGKGKKVLVEYSSPNIAKPFTVGHLRSTIIGDAIANTLDFLGYKVIRDNHLGDWGTQFGKLIFAIEKWDPEHAFEKSEDPIKSLVDLYVKFNDEVEHRKATPGLEIAVPELEEGARARFQLLETGRDLETMALWKKCIELSMKEFKKIYDILDIHFDTQKGESEFVDPKQIQKVLDVLKSKNLLKESEGAQVVFFEGEKYPPLIIEKTDGTSIYATRDLAADMYRKGEYGDNLTIVNEVGSEQTLYFKQLFEIERMLGWFKEGQRVHVAHGLYRFKDGKMSTRKGNVIWLKDILDEAEKRAAAINPESAHDVAIGAIKFNDLKRDSGQDIIFNWDEILNMTGDSGPYLQYSAVRAQSILDKAEEKNMKSNLKALRPDTDSLDQLERYMIHFPNTIAFSGSSYKPNILAGYLIKLASLFNSFYAQNVVLDEKNESAEYNLAIVEAFKTIMTNGLHALGIKVPKKM